MPNRADGNGQRGSSEHPDGRQRPASGRSHNLGERFGGHDGQPELVGLRGDFQEAIHLRVHDVRAARDHLFRRRGLVDLQLVRPGRI